MTGPGVNPAAVQAQVASLLAAYGEAVTLDSGGVTRAVVGVFDHPNAAVIATFFDDNEAVGLTKPAISLYLDGTVTPPAVTDTFARDGRTYTVRKVGFYRLAGTVVVQIVIGD